MPIKRHYYGWYERGQFRLSRLPADSPVRPSVVYETVDDIKALLTRRGVTVDWWPLLPDDIHAEIQKGLRLDGRQQGLSVAAAEGVQWGDERL